MDERTDIVALKAELRAQALQRRDAIEGRAERSAAICTRLIGLPQFQAAAAIHCFLPIRSEVDTRPIIAAALSAGKAVAIPITAGSGPLQHSWITSLEPEAFTRGGFGTLRPVELAPAAPGDWALTVVPLLAFDRAGFRLGYGKGHYDALLSATESLAVGVAFAAQELPRVPREAHDQALAIVVTEDELVEAG